MTLPTFALLCVGLVTAPFVVYLFAKLATYGVLMGRRRFERDYPEAPKKGSSNGQD